MWVNLGFRENVNELLFLGFARGGVNIAIDPVYAPIVTDTGGSAPTDLIFDGSSAMVSASFTRWNEESYARLADHGAKSTDARRRGAGVLGRVGTIMGMATAAFQLLVIFPYAFQKNPPGGNRPAAILNPYASMPVGYRFPQAVLDRDGLPARGARPAHLDLTFRCLRQTKRELLAKPLPFPAENEDLYLLYDHNVDAIRGNLPD